MDDLKEIIEILIEKMKKYRSLYERNEMATRGQIIEPILKGLGWNIENPEEIQPNISFEEGVPDYSLLKNDKNILFIENVDIVDGTPLLDIKPYIPKFDNRDTENIGWLKGNIQKLPNKKDDGRFRK